jgi:hypothetical protein
VIDMRVAQDHGIDLLRVEWKVAIPLGRFSPSALKQTAFQQDLLPIELQQIHRSRCGPSSAQEMNLHHF